MGGYVGFDGREVSQDGVDEDQVDGAISLLQPAQLLPKDLDVNRKREAS